MRILRTLAAAGLVLMLLFSVGCSSSGDFDHQLNVVTKPYAFSVAGWEFATFWERTKELFTLKDKTTQTDTQVTDQYIALHNQINDLKNQITNTNRLSIQPQIDTLQAQQDKITPQVEKIIKKQTSQVLKDLGIYQPWYKYIGLKVLFPAPDFKIEPLPHLLVISPKNKIDEKTTILLQQNLTLAQMIQIEGSADNLNVSALVVDLGGISTYPSLVSADSDFQFLVETCAHEWAHAYLTFEPLGFRYILNQAGLTHNDDITTMNESTADIIGKEVGAAVIKKYYPQFQTTARPAVTAAPAIAAPAPEFNFNQTMHSIRMQVDAYLAAGQVDTAEQYMDQQQIYLAANGYYIRKLNQAYFAFYGTYADSPAYENPIGTKIKQIRAESTSLKSFLSTMSAMTGPQNLDAVLK